MCRGIIVNMNKKNLRVILLLHILLMAYSLGGICSKTAANSPFMSFKFVMCYGIQIGLLGMYAIGWQQIIKRLTLTTAFANKAVTLVWGIIWGAVFFKEKITVGKIVGALIVITGVILYVKADAELEAENGNIEDEMHVDVAKEVDANE